MSRQLAFNMVTSRRQALSTSSHINNPNSEAFTGNFKNMFLIIIVEVDLDLGIPFFVYT